jgi:hypothetical protein
MVRWWGLSPEGNSMRVRIRSSVMAAALATACVAWSSNAGAQTSAASLRATYEKQAPALAASPFGRPVSLSSSETEKGLQGEVYGVLDRPLSEVARVLDTPTRWCEMLMLHLNNRRCRADDAKQSLTLSVVGKYDIPVEQASNLTFAVRSASATADYFDTTLTSGKGPYGTSNYRISLQGIPLENGKSFVHFSYAYDQGTATGVATKGYLATFGRGKVGFTVTGKKPSGEPELVEGMLALIERNAMRYFLAVDAYTAAPDNVDKRLTLWHAGTEKYPRQLHDLSEADYLKIKRGDLQQMAK